MPNDGSLRSLPHQKKKGGTTMKLKVKNEKTSAVVKATGVDPCTHTTCLN